MSASGKIYTTKKFHSRWERWEGANHTSVGQIEDSFGGSWYSWKLLKFPNEFHCPLGIWVCPDLVFEKKRFNWVMSKFPSQPL